MKRLLTLIIAAIALQSCSLAHLIPSYPSPSVDVTINIDLQPAWGPIGYDYAAYYYMPELNIYYDINHSLFYYPSGSRWISAKYLPPSYRVYDLFKVYKVVLNYDEPWNYNRAHRTQYKHYRDDRSQISIRMSNDKRYEKSWNNLRPWVDPDRRNNRENNYYLRTQNQQAGSNKYIEDHRDNGYRVEGEESDKQSPTAGGSYRGKDTTPNKPATNAKPTTEKDDRQPSKTDKSYNAPSSSSSYRQQNSTQSSSASNGVSSRGKARNQSTAPKSSSKSSTKPSTEKSTRSTSSQPSSSTSPSTSYRAGNSSSTNTSTRGR